MLNQPIPGFNGGFTTSGKWSGLEADQITTLIYDYIRSCINLVEQQRRHRYQSQLCLLLHHSAHQWPLRWASLRDGPGRFHFDHGHRRRHHQGYRAVPHPQGRHAPIHRPQRQSTPVASLYHRASHQLSHPFRLRAETKPSPIPWAMSPQPARRPSSAARPMPRSIRCIHGPVRSPGLNNTAGLMPQMTTEPCLYSPRMAITPL